MAAMKTIRVRDPGAPLSAADEHHLPYQTKLRTRPVRGPRSLEAAIAQIKDIDGRGGEPFPSERFSDVAWTPVFGRDSANKAIHPAEQFFRFSAFRYLVDEGRKNARACSRELAQVLLQDAEAVNRLNRYYYDCPSEELPSLHTCSEAAAAAFNAGWLPHVGADSLSDDGARAVLRLINLRKCDEQAESGSEIVVAVGFGKSPSAVEACIDEVRSCRLAIGKRARTAMKSLFELCAALDTVHDMPRCRVADATKLSRSVSAKALSAAKSLQALEVSLRPLTEVRWKVDVPSEDFVKEVGSLASDLPRHADLSGVRERIRALGRTLATLRTGISMANVARRLGGGNFFEEIEVPASDEDLDEENCVEEVVCSIDPEKYVRLLSALDAWKLREFGEIGEKDIWMSRLPPEVIAETGTLVD